jgi:hypothetical protein
MRNVIGERVVVGPLANATVVLEVPKKKSPCNVSTVISRSLECRQPAVAVTPCMCGNFVRLFFVRSFVAFDIRVWH